MADIDPSRLSAIFRALSSKESMRACDNKNYGSKSEVSAHSITIQKTNTKSKEYLKSKINLRISKLKKTDVAFQEKATAVTIQEILLWEFGDEIINHPDFNLLSLSIIKKVTKNHELFAYLQKFIAEVK